MVLKFLSVSSMVMAPASTGRDSSSSTAVMNTDHTNSGILSKVIPGALMFITVVIKFIAPIIEDAPAQCRLNMARSTDPPEWVCGPDRGGYTVHPVPAPCSIKEDPSRSSKAGGSSQKLRLFSLGNAMSGAPMYKGTSQLPNPPISTGITKKNIITKACAVTMTLYK